MAREVIVIGAGIVGASIAWHLARVGAKVTILDKAESGGVATPCSFGWINASFGNPEPYYRLRIRAMAEWKRLAAEVPDLPVRWQGGLCWDRPRAELEGLGAEHASWGYGVRELGRDEIARIEPNLTAPPDFALLVAEEGAAEPQAVARMLTADAQKRGARLVADAEVHALYMGSASHARVETNDKTFEADEIVLAAGAASAALANTAGIILPMNTPPGLLVHSRPHPPLLNGLVMADRVHMRQTVEGRLVAGADYGGADPGPDAEATARGLFDTMKSMLKGAEALQYEGYTLGFRPTPLDGFPALGRSKGIGNLYIAVTHSGITLAPAIGHFAAQEILDGIRDPLLAPYGADRFD
ncbi:MAG: FAD-binding oxidoreductase [Hyphomicrobiales bacterium]|nr:FAD-binding oxidoreductase [Hyphomicrobiales bacterium]